ncbi:MAG: hypothetical protein ABIJ45_08375 [Candidatus Zixiibacteriota bacterium]
MNLQRGEKWLRFFSEKGWLKNDVLSGGESDKLKITVRIGGDSSGIKSTTIESALYQKDLDILCYETPGGTVYFQWDDIITVQQVIDNKKKGWL